MAQKSLKPKHRDLINLNEVRVATRRLLLTKKLSKEIEKDLRVAVPRYRKLLNMFAAAHSQGSVRQQQAALRRLEQSSAAKLVAFILANGRGRNVRQMSWTKIKETSQHINPRKPSGEYIRAKSHEKSNGGRRDICSFGPISRGTQRFIEHVIISAVGHSRYEHARKGRGREVAIRKTLHCIETKGVWWFGLLDVEDFFPSITREMVKDVLGFLPTSYIEASLFIHKDTEIRHKCLNRDGNKSSEAAIRNGLPQGSLTSVLVASKVLEKHLDCLQARHAISHVDDLLIGGKTEAEVYAKIFALASSLEGHHSGSLHLTGDVCKIGDHQMNYLGYRIRPRSAQFGGSGRAMFSNAARHRFLERLASKLLFVFWETRGTTINEECARWVRSFPCWSTRIDCEDIAVIDALENLLPSVELAGLVLNQPFIRWTSLEDLKEFRAFASREIAISAGRNFTTGGDLNHMRLQRLALNLQLKLS